MKFETKTCPVCKQHAVIIPSNNPLIPSICEGCIRKTINFENLEHADFFCRTYNLPFDPELWMRIAKSARENTVREYVAIIASREKESLYYGTQTADLWKKANEEWGLVREHAELIAKLAPIKDGYLLRNKIKWGSDYTFEELIMLENLFVNTLKSNDISNPMQVDAIKKACKMSVALDRAITNGDSKEINDLSKAYQNFIKTAKIDDIITAASQDVISNVAELVEFIEESGFKFEYYDKVERDVVDESINDIKRFIKDLVLSTSGAHLESVFESINMALQEEKDKEADEESFKRVSLEDLYESNLARRGEFEDDPEEDYDFDIDESMFNEDDEDDYF